jgi:hypothetical protein
MNCTCFVLAAKLFFCPDYALYITRTKMVNKSGQAGGKGVPGVVNYDVWPSPVVLLLAQRLYEEITRSAPEPGDEPWDALDPSLKESYCLTMTSLIQKLEVEIGLVTGVL